MAYHQFSYTSVNQPTTIAYYHETTRGTQWLKFTSTVHDTILNAQIVRVGIAGEPGNYMHVFDR